MLRKRAVRSEESRPSSCASEASPALPSVPEGGEGAVPMAERARHTLSPRREEKRRGVLRRCAQLAASMARRLPCAGGGTRLLWRSAAAARRSLPWQPGTAAVSRVMGSGVGCSAGAGARGRGRSGRAERGLHSLKVTFLLCQHLQEQLDLDLSPLEYMMKCYPEIKEKEEMRKIIGRYGLTGKQQVSVSC